MQYLKPNVKNEYLKQTVMSASAAELIVMLFDGCIKNLKLAELSIEKNDMEGTHNYMMKAQQIVTELMSCLDMSFEISMQMLTIYEFINKQIRDMNTQKDLSPMPDVLRLLDECRKTWQSVAKLQRDQLTGESYG